MPDYSKGKIYTIRCRNDDTKIYVGSTIQSLAVRFGAHKRSSKSEKCKKFKLYIEVNGDWSNWYIELYELFPCSCKDELCKREGEIIRLIGNLNMIINGRDKKEYYENNKDKLKEKNKEYYKDNVEEILEKQKMYYKDNADEILEKQKMYYKDNADQIKERVNQYRKNNADKIKERKRLYYLRKKNEKLKEISETTA
jgi:DNA polymerase III delta prime subunit